MLWSVRADRGRRNLAVRPAAQPGLRPVERSRARLDLVPGPVALVGAGEFLPAMAAIDAELLATSGRRRPRVAILPTASWPDGEAVFQRWAALGLEHFENLGAEVEVVNVRERPDADDAGYAQAVGEADLVYLSGGKPGHLLATLRGSAVWAAALAAHERGCVLAGCSAGAMVLCAQQARFRFPPQLPLGFEPGLGVVAGAAVLPHYDRFPETLAAARVARAPGDTVVLGIDENTAAIGRDGAWQVRGTGRVTLWRGLHRERHGSGDTFRF
ncbi:MAG: Type 1 glutamine amidotransferase-like domain-containing protein [Candidatus Limnocylindrales bacterium]